MKWAIGILILCQSAAASLRYLCIVQNNNYKLTVNKKVWELLLINLILTLPTLFIGLFLGDGVLDTVIKILYAAVAVLAAFYIVLGYRTQPKFTKRAKSVYGLALALGLPIYALINALAKSEALAVILNVTLGVVAPFFIDFATCALNPHFERKNAKFIERNCAKLVESNAIRIGITGSYGKTSCKNILCALLQRKYSVISTDKNYNTPMGIALTAERMTGKEEIFIAEMGARRRGDVAYLADLVKPHYSITTGVCPQHLATFKSVHNIFLEKSELSKRTQILSVFNCNDKYALKMYKECKGKKLKVCIKKEGDVYATDIVSDENGSSFNLIHGNQTLALQTKLLGRHNVINIALCAALALELGVDERAIKDAVKELKPIPHRLEYIYSNGIHILDDSYNSNPVGIKSAMEVLDGFHGRKVVLSQGLVEGGKKSAELNINVGRDVAGHADVVMLCGKNAKHVEKGLTEGGFNGKVYRYRDLKRAQAHFKDVLQVGDVLLLQNDLPDIY